MYRGSDSRVPAAAPLTGHLLYSSLCQEDEAQEPGKLQSFGSVAVLAAPVVVWFLAVAHFVAATAAAAAAAVFAAFVAVAPVAVAGDTVAAFAAAVAFAAVGFVAAADVAAVAAAAAVEVDAADATVAAAAAVAAAGDDDAFVAAASGGEFAAESWAARHRTCWASPCYLEKQGNTRMRTAAACWV